MVPPRVTVAKSKRESKQEPDIEQKNISEEELELSFSSDSNIESEQQRKDFKDLLMTLQELFGISGIEETLGLNIFIS